MWKDLFYRKSYREMKLFLGFVDFCFFNEDMIDDINRCFLLLVYLNE